MVNDLRAPGPPRVGDLDVIVRGSVVDGLRMRATPNCRGGVLLGTRVDGRTEIDAAVQVAEAPAPPALNLTPEAWAAAEIVRGRDHPDLEVVGWWEYRPGGLAFPTAVDEFVHQAWFAESSQVALLVGERPGDQGVWAWREGRLTRVPADRVFTLVAWTNAGGPPPEVPVPVRLGTSLFPDYDPTPPSTPAIPPPTEPISAPASLSTVDRTYGELAQPEEEAVVPDWMADAAEGDMTAPTARRVVGVLTLLAIAVLLVLAVQRLVGDNDDPATTTTTVAAATTAATVQVTAPPSTEAVTTTLIPPVDTTAPATTAPAVETTTVPDPGFREYTIQEGDTIGGIAEAVYGRERCRLGITDASGDAFGASEVIRPGEIIRLPTSFPDEECTLDEAALAALVGG